MRTRGDCAEALFGRRAAASWLVLLLAGGTAFLLECAQGHAPRAFGALIASWLFFTGAVLGAMAFLAILELSRAGWADELMSSAERLLGFIPVAGLLLGLFVVAHRAWAPWVHETAPARASFLNGPSFVVREVVAGGVLLGLARLYTVRRAAGMRSARLAVAVCLLYAVVLSIWAFDFILGLDAEWVSTLIGPHLFVGALVSGIGTLTILWLLTGHAGASERHDLGKLLFGFSLLWAYLLFSQILPIWYANLPEETGFLLRRVESPWRSVSLVVVLLAFALPFLGLLHERAKRAPRVLGCLSTIQLAGLWLEKHLLVVPSLLRPDDAALDLRDGLIALGALAAFVLAIGRPLARRKPHPQGPQEHDWLIPFPAPRKR